MLLDVFQLIHSLTKAEKRYFQQHASRHVIGEKNNYLKLFDALNRQGDFNEASIVMEFKGKHLYLLKRHLQKSILKSLLAFHASSSISVQIHSMIMEVELLYKKGLTKAALKLIHHAKKIALRHELHLELTQLLEWEIRLLASTHQHVRTHQKINRGFEEAARQMELYNDFQKCYRFRLTSSALHNKEILIRRSEEKEKQKELLEQITHLSGKDLSGKAKWELYNGAGTYYSTLGDHRRGNSYHKKAAALTENKALTLHDELRQHLVSLFTQSINSYYLKNFDNALSYLKIMRGYFSSLSDIENRQNIRELHFHSLLLEGFILMDMDQYKKARPVINELAQQLMPVISSINTSLRNDFYYQQTGFWFCTGNYAEAEHWLIKMLQDEDAPKENPARYRFARLMQLIILFEKKEFGQVENLLPTARRFFRKKNLQYKIEETALKFLAKKIKEKEKTDLTDKNDFAELRKNISRIARLRSEAVALRFFDYAHWAKAKIENKTMAETNK
jgi:hypothetical protein